MKSDIRRDPADRTDHTKAVRSHQLEMVDRSDSIIQCVVLECAAVCSQVYRKARTDGNGKKMEKKMNQEENKKTNVEKFLENCTDQELMFLLRFTKAQLEDKLELKIALRDPANSEKEMTFNGIVNNIIAQNAEPADLEKLLPEEIKQKIASEIRDEKWTGGVDWAVEKRR